MSDALDSIATRKRALRKEIRGRLEVLSGPELLHHPSQSRLEGLDLLDAADRLIQRAGMTPSQAGCLGVQSL